MKKSHYWELFKETENKNRLKLGIKISSLIKRKIVIHRKIFITTEPRSVPTCQAPAHLDGLWSHENTVETLVKMLTLKWFHLLDKDAVISFSAHESPKSTTLLHPLTSILVRKRKGGSYPSLRSSSVSKFQVKGHSFALYFLFVCLFYGHTRGTWKFPGQEMNQSHSCDLHHSCINAWSFNTGSFNPLHPFRIEPAPLQQPKLLQWDS